MPFEKGKKKTGGRKKGTPDKTTDIARMAITKLVDTNTPNMIKWLEEIAAKDPKDAFDCMTRVMEYHLPKMQRVQHSADDGMIINIEMPKDAKDL